MAVVDFLVRGPAIGAGGMGVSNSGVRVFFINFGGWGTLINEVGYGYYFN